MKDDVGSEVSDDFIQPSDIRDVSDHAAEAGRVLLEVVRDGI
jgi:hypothetical protein